MNNTIANIYNINRKLLSIPSLANDQMKTLIGQSINNDANYMKRKEQIPLGQLAEKFGMFYHERY